MDMVTTPGIKMLCHNWVIKGKRSNGAWQKTADKHVLVKFLGQGFQKLQPKLDRHRHDRTHYHAALAGDDNTRSY